MISRTTRRFREELARLPDEVQRQARKAYRLFRDNPRHPSLRLKRVHPIKPIYSVRVSRNCRALGVLDGDTIVWFWIGNHGDYERLIAEM